MTAAAGITTSAQPPTAVVNIQPGMNIQPVVLVDANGQYVTPGGTATTAGSLATTTNPVNVAAASAPSANQSLIATSATTATWQFTPIAGGGTGQVTAGAAFNALSPMTTLGDTIAENSVPTAVRVAGNTTATKNFYTQTGTGSASALPVWGTIAAADLPTGTTSAQGALQLDGTAANILPDGVRAAGANGKPADSGHVHQNNADLSLYLAPAGATGETYPRGLNSAYTAVLTSGQSYVSAIPLPGGLPVNNLATIIGSTAFNGVTHGWFALLDSSRIVRAVTADQTSSFGAASTALSLPPSSGYTTPSGALYYFVVCVVASTMGTLPLGNSPLSGSNTAVPILAGTSATGLTTPPALSSTMSTINPNGAFHFYGYTS